MTRYTPVEAAMRPWQLKSYPEPKRLEIVLVVQQVASWEHLCPRGQDGWNILSPTTRALGTMLHSGGQEDEEAEPDEDEVDSEDMSGEDEPMLEPVDGGEVTSFSKSHALC